MLAAATAACSNKEQAAREALQRGDAYASSGQYNAAVLEYRTAIAKRPGTADTYRRLGAAYAALGRDEEAYRAFANATDVDPDDRVSGVESGRLLLASRLYDQAQIRAEQVLDVDPLNADARVLRYRAIGDAAAAVGDLLNAEAAYRSAVVDAPQSAEAFVALAQFLLSTNRLDEAEQVLRNGVTASPASELSNRALAAHLIRSGHAREAEPYLKTAAAQTNQRYRSTLALADYYYNANRYAEARAILEQTPGDAAKVRLAAIQYETGEQADAHARLDRILKKRRNAQGMALNAQFLRDEQHLDEAVQSARAALAIEPRLTAAHFIVGSVALDRGDLDEAAREFEEVLRLNPAHVAARLQLARARLAAGQAADAVSLASSSGGGRDARLTLAHALVANGQTAEARQELTRLSIDDRTDPEPEIALATLDFDAGALASASEHAERAVAAAPNSADAADIAGRVAVARGDEQAAIRHLTHATALAPDWFDAPLALAHLHAERGDLDRARTLILAFATKHPDAAAPRSALGIIEEAAGRPDEARKAFEMALTLDPREAVAAGRLARIYLQDASTAESAIELARAAVSAEPDQADAHATLGRAYFKTGRLRSAVSELERAATLDAADASVRRDLSMKPAALSPPRKTVWRKRERLSLSGLCKRPARRVPSGFP